MAEKLEFASTQLPPHSHTNYVAVPKADAMGESIRPRPAIRYALVALIVSLVMTDRLGIAVDSLSLGPSLPLTYGLLAVLLMSGWLAIDLPALLVYIGICTVAIASYWLNAFMQNGTPGTMGSMFLLMVIYLPFVFSISAHPNNRGHWLWTMRVLSNTLLVGAAAGIIQFYAQFVIRAPWLFDISVLIPEGIRAQGIYNSTIPVGSFFKANGIFFREPSNFSYMMAFGLVMELAIFKRVKRMFCFGLALILSYSGTGLLALAIGLLLPLRARLLLRIGIAAAVILTANSLTGDPLNLAFTFGRTGEFTAPGSSAYARYVAPMQVVDAFISTKNWSLWVGNGPGLFLRTAAAFEAHDPTWAKLLFEYGLLGFILMLGLVGYKLSAFPAPFQLRAVLFANWLVMGGYLLIPETVCFVYLVLALWPSPPLQSPSRTMAKEKLA
ncbi:hypothetical protein [Rhodoferax sp. WC2427]|uniref:hypothetical protein n=1 Tax=Rhodoferax sp. WC2427 TaxID=3234144 RepID=UPI0034656E34